MKPAGRLTGPMIRVLIVGGIACVLAVIRVLGNRLPFRLLDSHLFYSLDYARSLFASLSPENVAAYLRLAAADGVFILVYTTALVRLLDRRRLRWPRLHWVPWAAGCADVLETGTAALVLLKVLPPDALVVPVAMTPVKWIGVASCVVLLVTRDWGEVDSR